MHKHVHKQNNKYNKHVHKHVHKQNNKYNKHIHKHICEHEHYAVYFYKNIFKSFF